MMRRENVFAGVFRGLVLSGCIVVLGACGSSSSTKSSSGASSSASSSTSSPSSTLAVSVKDMGAGRVAFTAPASINGGAIDIQLTNAGKKLHHAQIVAIDSGHTVEETYKIFVGPTSPRWLHALGGVGGTAPGASNTAHVVLPAGSYYIFDAGMKTNKGFAKFQVQGSGSAAKLPSTTATITAQELAPKKSAFKVSGLKAGENAITFQSPAANKEIHQFAAIELQPGATLSAVKKFLSARGKPSGPPPFAGRPGAGGSDAAVIDPGLSEVANIKLKAGSSYALLCFLSDREGGPPHFTEGMLAKVDIK